MKPIYLTLIVLGLITSGLFISGIIPNFSPVLIYYIPSAINQLTNPPDEIAKENLILQDDAPDHLEEIFALCACYATGKQDCAEPLLQWQNSTHFIDNNLCEFIPLEQVGETTDIKE